MYQNMYLQKRKRADELAEFIPDNSHIWIDIGLGQPKNLIREMGKIRKKCTVHNMLDLYPSSWFSKEKNNWCNGVSWFSGSGARCAVNQGNADIMPCYYRDIPSLLEERSEIDCICASVSPMDKHGYFSLGLTNSASEKLLKRAKYIFLEVNKKMPRSLSSPMVHISEVTAFCECDYDLPESGNVILDDISISIGNIIAEEVPNGATIQLGIGAIPNAVGNALKTKKHLGIHTELFTDSMIELLECGAADNSQKPVHTGKSVTTFAFGSQKMYDYIDDNPAIEILPVDYVNNPEIIAQHPNFISVNSAIEIDFMGQVCAESIGTKHMSGTGGQVDYVRGAVKSQGGKSFIAFPSTAQNGTCSRIKATLSPGAVVTTSKNDVDYVVTEYGIAKLRGKTLRERVQSLIQIAHPKFREELIYEAQKRQILF